MKLADINETVFQSLNPEVQMAIVEAGSTTAVEIIGYTVGVVVWLIVIYKMS